MAAARCPPLVLMLLLSCTACCVAGAGSAVAAAEDEKLTHLQFYFHEFEAGAPNATVVSVVSLNKSARAFGDVNIFDNALREGPDPTSRLIGRAQGFAMNAAMDGSRYFTAIEFVFSGDDGEYSGSTLSVQGEFYTSGGLSERTIVGGTGKLRFARGYMNSRVLSATETYLLAVIDMYFTLAY